MQHITSVEDFVRIIKKNKLTVIDFYTIWCKPCKQIAPFMEALSEKYSEVAFYKIDAEDYNTKKICESCKISAYPTFCFFCNSVFQGSVIGSSKQEIEDMIIDFLKNE